ncbi:hypothetical protein BDQ12DRAFT_691403 [Crucibulum laeve]|uniref:Uncharacterized protein n=1 Tax=Crucibulum laeve TaxID=68775 RepID=A0A5C3LKX9_9AGAR|nr:hypothetical protein BDQ12DRAFT_691396 [Crucibulum laeve]TFK33305.1 hypothetical protein BDQ12DRAFT_691403 [Crucibulum laeve]
MFNYEVSLMGVRYVGQLMKLIESKSGSFMRLKFGDGSTGVFPQSSCKATTESVSSIGPP